VVASLLLTAVVGEGWFHTGARWWLLPWQGVVAVAPTSRPGWFAGLPVEPPRRSTGQVLPPAAPGAPLASGLAEAYVEYSPPAVFALRRTSWEQLGVGLAVRADGLITRLRARPYAELGRPGGRTRQLPARVGGGAVRVLTRGRGGQVVARESCFPGWQQRIGGEWRPAACKLCDDDTRHRVS
jgi:hypothetical protein